MTAPTARIIAHWGPQQLRAWMLDASGTVTDQRTSLKGTDTLQPDTHEPALLALIGDALPDGAITPVLLCGSVGGQGGWHAAPEIPVPCTPPDITRARLVGTQDPRLRLHILPGVAQTRPADVMHGAETAIGGFLSLNPGFDGVICLSGAQSVWAHVSAGEIVSFRSFLTPELITLLTRQSSLRNALKGDGWDDATFAEALDQALSRPANIAADLASLRAEALLGDLSADAATARLWGALLGVELAAAKPYWLGQQVALLADGRAATAYRTALAAQGNPVTLADPARMMLAGLTSAFTPKPKATT